MKKLILAILLFIITFLVYKLIYPHPRDWYDHFIYLSRALLSGHVNVTNLPSFYQDVIIRNNKVYLPFPPIPAVVIIPFLLAIPKVTQQQVSILIGALDVSLTFLLLSKFTDLKKSFLLSIFAGVGTALFWASVVGTTWYYAHVVAFLFLTLSLIFHFRKNDILSGICFSLAVLCRYPILLGVIFFLLELRGDRKRLIKFLAASIMLAPIHFIYSYIRFGSFFQTGYYEVYLSYVKYSYPYTILQLINPKIPLFGYLDPRNIPLHLFTFLVEPPIITSHLQVSPSPYGMGILFTTPLLFLALKPYFKKGIETSLIIGSLAIAAIDFMHYMQGWVQFGYRFVLDFLPFLLILLALRFKLNKVNIFLLIISVAISFWGVMQAINLGW